MNEESASRIVNVSVMQQTKSFVPTVKVSKIIY